MTLEGLVIGFFVLVLAACLGGPVWLTAQRCENQWARSGLKAEWGFTQGCMVQRKDGTWVPASTIRELSP